MATPSEQQRIVHERKIPPPPVGLDALSYRCIGRWRRAPWRTKGLAASAIRVDLLRQKFEELKEGELNEALSRARNERLARSDSDNGVLEEGLALLAVAAKRELGLAAYSVQLMASEALIRGFLTEVDTGEGKTLALALTAAYQAWSGFPCHVITANDYLAGRDAGQLEPFYRRVGLTVGKVLGESTDEDRRRAYGCDVTYTTAKEVAADYLRDRIRLGGMDELGARTTLSRLSGTGRFSHHEPVQRGLYFALLDEADNALIDEAVTPLIISRSLDPGELEIACSSAWNVASKLSRGVDYEVDMARKSIEFVPGRLDQITSEWEMKGARLWSRFGRRTELLHLAVEAREFFRLDEHYVIEDEKVVIVDEATGRPMPMRTWRQGLHQMIEAKEGVPLSGVTETIARISFQEFFGKYESLAGASGTVKEVAAEIWQTYGLPTLPIPRNLPCQRQFLGRRFYSNLEAKAFAIGAEVKVRHARGQPTLVGVRSVESSELLADLLLEEGLICHVLNARRHKEEAVMVRAAGSRSRITIATNMAGRGTDILLGHGVDNLGGLHVVASEPHESARVDRQLYGRSGRQGDPGSVLAFFSAEDPLFVRFLPKRLLRFWTWMLKKQGGLAPVIGQRMGSIFLRWSQFRAQSQAVRRRRQVMKTEAEIRRNLGFSKGRNGS
tara:strand:- start:1277 stop:3286 length:2010 start_codon:yes stop_codon:yes gene_type:complete